MSEARYPLTPPASTSLPEHWQFVPPPTDGPNTRARRARGLQPYSGSAAPLPVELAARGPPGAEVGRNALARVEEWTGWNNAPTEQQYWYAAGPSESSSTYFAIDPNLSFDPAPPSPPPPISAHAYSSPSQHQSYAEDRRLFSTATVIDHGSPPTSPVLTPALPNPPASAVSAGGLLALGISKEEWLRLGGFAPEDFDHGEPAAPPPPPPVDQYAATHEDPFAAPPYRASHSAHPLGVPSFPAQTPSYAFAPPPASAPPAATYVLPPVYAASDLVDELPIPPPLPSTPSVFAVPKAEDDPEWDASRPPTRSRRRRAPSPLNSTRLRPTPYPTSSSSSASPRVLTPVSTALALYAQYPVPEAPPPVPDGPPKKKHGRRFSVNHVPRPRNAFILFRSHAVSTGLIPRSMGITDHKNISQIVGSVWRGLSPDERKKWEDLAEEEKRQHKERYPDYVFRPKSKGQRAPVGHGKKAKAKAAQIAAERARNDALAGVVVAEPSEGDGDGEGEDGSGDADGDDEGGVEDPDDAFDEPRKPRRRTAASARASPPKRASLQSTDADEDGARKQRRMELIGQAVLEGEDDDAILPRVNAELAAEEQAMKTTAGDIQVAASPSSTPYRRSSPIKASAGSVVTPRKTRSSIHQPLKQDSSTPPGIPVRGSAHASPGSSTDSTLSPSPYRRAHLPASPASTASPSPKRMQQPGSARSPSSGGRHPLSRSIGQQQDAAEHDLPASRRTTKARSYAAAGLGLASSSLANYDLAPHISQAGASSGSTLVDASGSHPDYAFPPPTLHAPLFAGPADSRQFSLGRWELRKPSTAAGSRREALAAQEEEAHLGAGAGAGANPGTSGWLDRAASAGAALALDPHAFLAESGLEDPAAGDALSEYGTASSALWDDGASSAYETAASSSAPPPLRMEGGGGRFPLFRATSTVCGTLVEEPGAGLFHFGEEDLFAQPPSAFGSAERTVSSVFGPRPGMASVVQRGEGDGEEVGLGIQFEGGGY